MKSVELKVMRIGNSRGVRLSDWDATAADGLDTPPWAPLRLLITEMYGE